MEHLIAIMFGLGSCTVFFELAYQSYLPALVKQDDLLEGNSKLMTSRSLADISGPGLADMLVHVLSAPFALMLSALSFAASAITLLRIRKVEPKPWPSEGGGGRREIVAGIRFTLGNRVLRAGALAAATYNFWWSGIQAVLVLYVVAQLGMRPDMFALTLTIGALGALLGSLLTAPISRRLGIGRVTVGSAALICMASLLLPLIDTAALGTVLLGLSFFLRGSGLTGWNVQIESLQQALVPNRLMGCMNGTYLLLSHGTGSAGALLGGLLGGAIGLRSTLAIGAVGVSLAWLWLLCSPLRTLSGLPQHASRAAEGTITARKGLPGGSLASR